MVIRHMESQRHGYICPLTGLQSRRPFYKGGAAGVPTGGLEDRPTGPEVEVIAASLWPRRQPLARFWPQTMLSASSEVLFSFGNLIRSPR